MCYLNSNLLTAFSEQIFGFQVTEDFTFVAQLCEDQAICIKVQILRKGIEKEFVKVQEEMKTRL